MRRRFNTLMKHLEIYDVHFHTLRHTSATQAIEEGINPKTVSEHLGHSSVSITLDRYVHPSEEEKRKYMNIYSSLLQKFSEDSGKQFFLLENNQCLIR